MHIRRQYQSSIIPLSYEQLVIIGAAILIITALIPIFCIIRRKMRNKIPSEVTHPLPMNNLLVENTQRSRDRRERQSNRQTLSQITRTSRRQDKPGWRSVDTLPLYSQNNSNTVADNTLNGAVLESMVNTLPITIEADENIDTPPCYGQMNDRV
jgi:hypothetical protein